MMLFDNDVSEMSNEGFLMDGVGWGGSNGEIFYSDLNFTLSFSWKIVQSIMNFTIKEKFYKNVIVSTS